MYFITFTKIQAKYEVQDKFKAIINCSNHTHIYSHTHNTPHKSILAPKRINVQCWGQKTLNQGNKFTDRIYKTCFSEMQGRVSF